MLLMACNNANAISWGDIVTTENVESVISAVTGGSTVTASSLTGTWKYDSPAFQLESDSNLTEAMGSIATSQVEAKLNVAFASVGITSGQFSFTFGSDGSFSCTCSEKTLSGKYTIDSDEKITLTFSAVNSINIGSVSAYTSLSSSTLSLLFDTDKLLTIIQSITSVSNSNTLAAVNAMLSNYNGVQIGFNLKK